MCWRARGGCRARPAWRPAGLGRGRRPTSTERPAPVGAAGPRAASRARRPRPLRAGLAPSATRYFTLPSNSPTTPSQPKSTYPIRPAASRTSFCSSGLGRLSRNIWTRDRLSPATHAQRVGQRAHEARGVAASNARWHGIHLGLQLRERAQSVSQGVVGRGDGGMEGAGASQVHDGPRSSGHPDVPDAAPCRPRGPRAVGRAMTRDLAARSRRVLARHPATARSAAAPTPPRPRSRRTRGPLAPGTGRWHGRGRRAVLGRQVDATRRSVTHTPFRTWCQPPLVRLDAGGAQVTPTTQDARVERDRGCWTEHPAHGARVA